MSKISVLVVHCTPNAVNKYNATTPSWHSFHPPLLSPKFKFHKRNPLLPLSPPRKRERAITLFVTDRRYSILHKWSERSRSSLLSSSFSMVRSIRYPRLLPSKRLWRSIARRVRQSRPLPLGIILRYAIVSTTILMVAVVLWMIISVVIFLFRDHRLDPYEESLLTYQK